MQVLGWAAILAVLNSCSSTFFESDADLTEGDQQDYAKYSLAQEYPVGPEQEYIETIKQDKLDDRAFLDLEAKIVAAFSKRELFLPSIRSKVERLPGQVDIHFNHLSFFSELLPTDSHQVFLELKDARPEDLFILIKSGFPILALAKFHFTHTLRQPSEDGISYEYQGFTIINGVQRIKAKNTSSKHDFDNKGDSYAFDSHEGFGFKAEAYSRITGSWLEMRYPPEKKGKLLLERYYLLKNGQAGPVSLAVKTILDRSQPMEAQDVSGLPLDDSYGYQIVKGYQQQKVKDREEEENREKQRNAPPEINIPSFTPLPPKF